MKKIANLEENLKKYENQNIFLKMLHDVPTDFIVNNPKK